MDGLQPQSTQRQQATKLATRCDGEFTQNDVYYYFSTWSKNGQPVEFVPRKVSEGLELSLPVALGGQNPNNKRLLFFPSSVQQTANIHRHHTASLTAW